MDDVSALEFIEWIFDSWLFVPVIGGIAFAVAAQRRRDQIWDRKLRRVQLRMQYETPGQMPTIHRNYSGLGPNPDKLLRGDRWETRQGNFIWDGGRWLPFP